MLEFIFTNKHPKIRFKLEVLFTTKLSQLFQKENINKGLFINIVFLNDASLLEINKEYLNHDYFTDILTFPIEETDEYLEADIYISMDRVKENAKTYNVVFDDELLRVVIHGGLHLCGYKDKTKEEELLMRSKETLYMLL